MSKEKKRDFDLILRLPVELVERLDKAAEHNGRTRTAEIRNRLEPGPTEKRLDEIDAQLAEIRGMLRKLLDATS
jgi:predicted DNA-binding protein